MSYPIQTIGPHIIRVFSFITNATDWLTAEQLSDGASIARSSAKYLAFKLTREGILVERFEPVSSVLQYKLAKNYQQSELAAKILNAQNQLSPLISGKTPQDIRQAQADIAFSA